MTKNLLDDLKAACQAQPSAGDAERVAEGESVWLAGRPVPADRGLIGLSLGDGHTTIVSESAVREVVKEEPFYFVRVPAGTSVLVRSETVTTVRDESRGCGCKDGKGPSDLAAVRQAPGGPGGGTGPIIIQCPLVCRIEMDCSFHLGRNGRLIRICVPLLFCRRECQSEPA
jgi:hypothetical protein